MNNADQIKKIVIAMQKGDQSQFSELYDLTNASAMVVAKKYLKQEADCEDVVQEAYITALNKINDLQKPESFSSWLNQIVATRSLNVLRKKNPVMFSEMTAEEDDADIDFEDESPQFSPEKITDMEAVSSAVSEVMDSLPEMQRDALWMHYGQDIPIKDIAEAAGVSENTIKSRLKQGRDKLYKQKEEFRKRGIEISVVTIATLLYTLFNRDIEVQAQELAASTEYVKESAELKKKIDARRSSAHTHQNLNHAGKAAGHTAVKAGLGTGVKVGIAIAAVAVGVASGVGIYHVQNNRNQNTAVKEKAGSETKKKSSSETKKKATPTPETQKNEEALKQYQAILAKASSMGPFTSYDTSSGEYMYALVTMQKGEGPTLLLAQGIQDDGRYNVRVYYYDESSKTMYQPEDVVQFGVAGVGGFRGVLNIEPDLNGLQLIDWGSGTGEGYDSRYTREGNTLKHETVKSFSMADGDQVEEGDAIQWYELTDTRALKQWPEHVDATGEDGFPAEYSDNSSTSEQTTATTQNESITGTYQDSSGYQVKVVDNGNGTIAFTSGGYTDTMSWDSAHNVYQSGYGTGAVYVDTSVHPYVLHLQGGEETLYTKID